MIELLPAEIRSHRTPDGLVLESPVALPSGPGASARCVGDWLVRWARDRPDATFLAERDARGEWTRLPYRDALTAVEGIASSLLDRGGAADRPVMILSDNSIAS